MHPAYIKPIYCSQLASLNWEVLRSQISTIKLHWELICCNVILSTPHSREQAFATCYTCYSKMQKIEKLWWEVELFRAVRTYESPRKSWNLILPEVVSASKFGNTSPSRIPGMAGSKLKLTRCEVKGWQTWKRAAGTETAAQGSMNEPEKGAWLK